MAKNTTPPRRPIPKWKIGFIVLMVLIAAVLVYTKFVALDGPIPAEAGEHYIGLEHGYTDQGFPYLGNADAPVVVEDFSSYACPHCREFHEDRFPDMLDEIAAGQVKFVMIPVPHIGAGAKDSMKALLCAGEQDQLWAMHDVLYYWQDQFLTRTFDEKRILDGAKNLDLDVEAFEACMASERITSVVDAARAEFKRRGLTGTPTFYLNGTKVKDYREFDDLGTLAEQLQAA